MSGAPQAREVSGVWRRGSHRHQVPPQVMSLVRAAGIRLPPELSPLQETPAHGVQGLRADGSRGEGLSGRLETVPRHHQAGGDPGAGSSGQT